MKKRMLSCFLLLLTALFISGCASDKQGGENQKNQQKQQEQAMGRYIEEEIALPENETTIAMIENKEGQKEIFTVINGQTGQNQIKHYLLSEDFTWKEAEMSWMNKVVKDVEKSSEYQGSIDKVVYGQDGNYYALLSAYKENGVCNFIYRSKGTDDFEKVEIPYLKERQYEEGDYEIYHVISDIGVLENGNLVLYNGPDDTCYIFSKEGKSLGEVEIHGQYEQGGMPYNIIVIKNEIIGMRTDSKGVLRYDGDRLSENAVIELDYSEEEGSFTLLKDGTLVLADRKGIHCLNEGGSLWETVADGELNSMSMPTQTIFGLFAGNADPQDFFIFYSGSAKRSLIHYIFDDNTVTVPSKELNIYSLTENATVRQAVSLFQRDNKDVKVNYVVAMTGEETDAADFIKALNTELLAGNGADVLLLDNLPVDSYIEKGVLADLNDILGEAKDSILPNILEAYQKDGKLYQLPTRINVPVIFGTKEALENSGGLEQIVSFMKNNPDKIYAKGFSYLGLAKLFLQMEFDSLFQSDRTLNTEAFQKFLDNLAYMKEKGCTGATMEGYDFAKSYPFTVRNKSTEAAIDILNSTVNLFVEEAILKTGDYAMDTLNKRFYGSGFVGINTGSSSQELAGKFVKFLYSENVQTTNVYDGFPVEKNALNDWLFTVSKEQEDMSMGISYGTDFGEDTMIQGAYPSESIRKKFAEMINELKIPMKPEDSLLEMILTEMEAFLNGTRSSEDTVQAVQTKVNTYLSE